MTRKAHSALTAPALGSADQVSPSGKGLRAVALHTANGETCVYTGAVSSITYRKVTRHLIPEVATVEWEKPAGAPGSGLRAILLPDGRVQDAGCLWQEWPNLTAWEAHHNLAGMPG